MCLHYTFLLQNRQEAKIKFSLVHPTHELRVSTNYYNYLVTAVLKVVQLQL